MTGLQTPAMQPESMVVGTPQPEVAGGGMGGGRPAQMMGFVDAVKNALMNNYANFSGRASRSEYWWFTLFNVIAAVIASVIDGVIGITLIETVPGTGIGYGPFYLLFGLAVLVPSLSLSFRRFHDIGKSAWFILIALIPCVGFILIIVWMCTDGEPEPNAYGAVPTNTI